MRLHVAFKRLPEIGAATKGDSFSGLPRRLLLLKDGDIGWADLEDVALDKEQAEQIIASFNDQGVPIPIDMHHATMKTEQGVNAPAVGWIHALAYVEGEGLYGEKIEWVDTQVAEWIRAGQYKFYSPVITFSEDDKIEKLHSVALTNKPRTKHLHELLDAAEQYQESIMKKDKAKAAEDEKVEGGQEDDMTTKLAELASALRSAGVQLADDADALTIVSAAIEALAAAPTEEETPAELKTLAAELGVTPQKLGATVSALRIKAERHDTLEKRLVTLEGEATARRVHDLIGEQIEAGKLNPKDEDAMKAAKKLAASDEETFKALYGSMQPIITPGKDIDVTPQTQREKAIKDACAEYDADPKIAHGADKLHYVQASLQVDGLAALTDTEKGKLKGGDG